MKECFVSNSHLAINLQYFWQKAHKVTDFVNFKSFFFVWADTVKAVQVALTQALVMTTTEEPCLNRHSNCN